MAKEIERKFLVTNNRYRQCAFKHIKIVQGYLCTSPDSTVRVRITDNAAMLTVKTRNHGCTRNEWEFEIDRNDALEMLENCAGTLIEKTRWCVAATSPQADGLFWEIDEFEGRHKGLTVAEIELPSPETPFEKPDFIGEEVTGNPAYYNSSLSAS